MADYHFNLEKFEYVRDRIVYRLVNYEKNKEILEDCPHLRLYDLALTFRWVAHSDDIGISTALVTNQELQVWGISMNELLLAARENTPRLFPVHMIDMDEMIAQAGIPISLDESAIPMYIMTNEQEVNGASVLLYDNVLESFALEKKTDFYILPSSIHEVILVPSNKIDDPSALLQWCQMQIIQLLRWGIFYRIRYITIIEEKSDCSGRKETKDSLKVFLNTL